MALANVQGYLASDGKFFFKDQQGAAIAYEEMLQFTLWCTENIPNDGKWSPEMIARTISAHWTLVRKV